MSEAREGRVGRQGRALGSPTRQAIFRYIEHSPTAVDVSELTAHFGLNHNGIRQHLANLCNAGLVLGEPTERLGPGRRAIGYRVVPGAVDQCGSSPYEPLSLMLIDVTKGGSPVEVGRAAGRKMAREAGFETDAVRLLLTVARRLGFEPHTEASAAGVDVVLDRCPFTAAVEESVEIVCELHRGLAEGIAAHASGSYTVDELVVRPPQVAGCRIRIARTDEVA
jgi:predicted ArsR family transcriptional regulator